tara:strand:- start:15650 stop:16090 length:441 start_codon:yes stop_codon:yes gene_type:complete
MFLSLAILSLQQGGSSNGAFFTINRIIDPIVDQITRFWRSSGGKYTPRRDPLTIRRRFQPGQFNKLSSHCGTSPGQQQFTIQSAPNRQAFIRHDPGNKVWVGTIDAQKSATSNKGRHPLLPLHIGANLLKSMARQGRNTENRCIAA